MNLLKIIYRMFMGITEQMKEKYVNTNWEWHGSNNGITQGTVTQVTDVIKKGNMHFVVFNNGQRLNIETMNDFVTKTDKEVTFIKSTDNKPIIAPDYLKSDIQQQMKMDNPTATNESFDSNLEYPEPKSLQNRFDPTSTKLYHDPVTQSPYEKLPQTVIKKDDDFFKMFETSERELLLKLKLKLPDINLLKLMIKNANNDIEFVDNLSKYIMSNINKDVISESIIKLLAIPNKKNKELNGNNDTSAESTT